MLRSFWRRNTQHKRLRLGVTKRFPHVVIMSMSAITEYSDPESVEAVVRTEENKIVSLKPVGLASLLIQKLATDELRFRVAKFLTNRCLLCDERKHYLVKDDATNVSNVLLQDRRSHTQMTGGLWPTY